MKDHAPRIVRVFAFFIPASEYQALAQEQEVGPQFEVASVRPPGARLYGAAISAAMQEMRRQIDSGHLPPRETAAPVFSGFRVSMDGITMRDLIAIAYGVHPVRIADSTAATDTVSLRVIRIFLDGQS